MKCPYHTELLSTSRDVYPITYDPSHEASLRASIDRKQGIQSHYCGTPILSPSTTAIEGAPVLEATGLGDDASRDITLTDTNTRQIPELPFSIYSLHLPTPNSIPIISVPPRRKYVWVWTCVSITSYFHFCTRCPGQLLTPTKCACEHTRIGISTQYCPFCGVSRCANCAVQKVTTR